MIDSIAAARAAGIVDPRNEIHLAKLHEALTTQPGEVDLYKPLAGYFTSFHDMMAGQLSVQVKEGTLLMTLLRSLHSDFVEQIARLVPKVSDHIPMVGNSAVEIKVAELKRYPSLPWDADNLNILEQWAGVNMAITTFTAAFHFLDTNSAAIQRELAQTVKFYLERLDAANNPTFDKNAPEIAKIAALIAHGADPEELVDVSQSFIGERRNLLHVLCRVHASHHPDQWLLDESYAFVEAAVAKLTATNPATGASYVELNALDADGYSPLHYAARNASPKIIRQLLDAGATAAVLSNTTNEDGVADTPLAIAKRFEHVEAVAMLGAWQAQQAMKRVMKTPRAAP